MSKTPMPTWVADSLIEQGIMTADRVTHTAKPRTCQKCWARILVGLNDIGWRVEVDPTPISNIGEALALISGRTTHGLFYGQLEERDPREINYRPANVRPIYATHRCHEPPLPAEAKFIALTLPTPTADDVPPF